jgi:hypothetical protein
MRTAGICFERSGERACKKEELTLGETADPRRNNPVNVIQNELQKLKPSPKQPNI